MHTITQLKAPWPTGAKVGDVIDFGGPVPAWAAGKCESAAEDAKATVKFEPAAKVNPTSDAEFAEFRAQAEKAFDALKAEHAETVKRLQADIDAGGQALQAALADAKTNADALAASQAEVADLKVKLEAAAKTGKK